jgi:predicted O-methyltransferase YrrM
MVTSNVTLSSIRQYAADNTIPVISARNAAFLQSLLMQHKPKQVLEIGSAIGVSTAVIAQSLVQWGGQLVSTEISVPTQAAAQANIDALGIRNVQSFCGDARDWLQTWQQQDEFTFLPFDCVFIDAHKNQTHTFYEACLPMLAQGATIIVDDVWKFRHKMQAFYALLAKKMQAYSLHFVDDGDATMVIRPQPQPEHRF